MAAALPYALMAGGTLMSMKAQQQQADDKRNTLNQQLERDDQAAHKSSELVLNEGGYYEPAARKQAMADQEGLAYDSSVADLKAGANGGDPAAVQTSGDAGAVSDDFVKAKADRAVTEGSRLTGIAREIAKTRAPSMLLGSEGQRGANLASNLQTLFGSNNNMARATQNDADTIEEPAYGGLGKIASSIGSAMAMGSIGKGAAAKSAMPMASNASSGIHWNVG